MQKIILLLLLVSLRAVAFCQAGTFVISGQVRDTTGNPLTGASVFCQNTTFGTITNNQGEFAIRLPDGGYDLVVSYTGFETQTFHISDSRGGEMKIALVPKDKNLSEVTVSGSNEVPDGLQKYGRFFTDNFIGSTANSLRCRIENPEALQFYFSKKRNRLKVKAKEDLIILNEALGYRIKYQLDSFSHDYARDISTYSGYPFFEELEGSAEQKESWANERATAYNGSRLHFLRAWYDSTLYQQGFRIEEVDPTKKILTTSEIKDPYDSTHYSVVENDEVQINWPGRLRVIYRNELPDKKFLLQYKLLPHLRSQISILDISEAFIIEQNGYFYEQSDIINSGYWSWEKVAELLPYDYDPGP